VLFLGVHGMDTGLGYSTPNLAEAEINRAFIDAADRVVVLADHTKWGTRGLAQIAPLDRADLVICDTGLPSDDAEHWRISGLKSTSSHQLPWWNNPPDQPVRPCGWSKPSTSRENSWPRSCSKT
jgi:hypothetical protein